MRLAAVRTNGVAIMVRGNAASGLVSVESELALARSGVASVGAGTPVNVEIPGVGSENIQAVGRLKAARVWRLVASANGAVAVLPGHLCIGVDGGSAEGASTSSAAVGGNVESGLITKVAEEGVSAGSSALTALCGRLAAVGIVTVAVVKVGIADDLALIVDACSRGDVVGDGGGNQRTVSAGGAALGVLINRVLAAVASDAIAVTEEDPIGIVLAGASSAMPVDALVRGGIGEGHESPTVRGVSQSGALATRRVRLAAQGRIAICAIIIASKTYDDKERKDSTHRKFRGERTGKARAHLLATSWSASRGALGVRGTTLRASLSTLRVGVVARRASNPTSRTELGRDEAGENEEGDDHEQTRHL